MKRIIPSVASANQLFLAEEIGAFPAGTLLHMDIEDGNFVNNITFGMRTVRSIANMFPQHPLCFHFMATNPSQYFEEIAKCGARQVAVHFEGLPYPSEELCRIRELGMIPGLAINLRTPISQVEPFFEYIDFLMVMTMDSGYGGTNGLGFCFANHDRIRQARAALPAGKELWVDGAMDETEMKNCFALGVDAVIAGRMIFPEKLAQAGETRRAYLPSERKQTPAQLLEQYTRRYCMDE